MATVNKNDFTLYNINRDDCFVLQCVVSDLVYGTNRCTRLINFVLWTRSTSQTHLRRSRERNHKEPTLDFYPREWRISTHANGWISTHAKCFHEFVPSMRVLERQIRYGTIMIRRRAMCNLAFVKHETVCWPKQCVESLAHDSDESVHMSFMLSYARACMCRFFSSFFC